MTDQAEALDAAVPAAAFEFLRTQTAVHGEILTRQSLQAGFQFHDQRVPLIGPQGIFKPAVLPEMRSASLLHRQSVALHLRITTNWDRMGSCDTAEGRRLVELPHAQELKPRPEFLEERFDAFRKAG